MYITLRTTEDIRAARERFPGIRGVMIGRGLLANPALAEEFEAGQSLAPEERQRRFRDFHDSLLAAYADRLGAPALPGSGKQEVLQSIVNGVLYGKQ